MEEEIIVHPFQHPHVGEVKAIDVQVKEFRDGKKKVYFRISWHFLGERIRGWFLAFVPENRDEFCLLVEEGPITYTSPGLQPASNGQPILIFQTCWAVGTSPPNK